METYFDKPIGTQITILSNSVTQLTEGVNNTQDGLAIVANGNTHPQIASGQYVYVKNHESLADGLYKASTAISTNDPLSTSNLTADDSGGLNDLKDSVDSLSEKIGTVPSGQTVEGQISALNSKLAIRSSALQDSPVGFSVNEIYYNDYFAFITYTSAPKVWSEGDSFGTIPIGMRPVAVQRVTGNIYANNIGVQIRIDTNGSVTYDSKTSVDGRISFTVMYVAS